MGRKDRFFEERNGADALSCFLIVLAFLLVFVILLCRGRFLTLIALILVLAFPVLIVALYLGIRALSGLDADMGEVVRVYDDAGGFIMLGRVGTDEKKKKRVIWCEKMFYLKDEQK